uniref:Reverse transcriptase domain-containing protein n=1 Tax=Nothobranchius furzeri TaxID=105023 RepID=A0A8C6L1N7_NOTFU
MCLFELGPPPLLLVALIYRPPKFDVDFLKDFSDLLSVNMLKYDHVLILGDFNIHVCCPDKPFAKDFLHLLGSLNLSQWVLGPTHVQGHTLDLVMSIGLSVAGVEILSPVFSDHSPILCDFNLPCMPAVASSHVRFRRVLNAAKVIELGELLCAEGSELHTMSLNAEELTLQFDSICKNILDKIAPLRIRKKRPRPEPWLSDDVRACRQSCRRAERKWKKDRLQVSREIFRESLFSYQQTLKEARVKFFADIVEKNSHDPRTLFSVVNSLLEFSDSSALPPTVETCNDFLHFFVDKVTSIRAAITNSPSDSLLPEPLQATLETFETVTLSDLEKLVAQLKPSGSPCDVLPPRIYKELFPVIGPLLLAIINGSLTSGMVPSSFKKAVIHPMLKKPGLDVTTLANYRPISKLPFLSKLLEKVVYSQLVAFLDTNDLWETFQSGFRKGHSTESALLMVFNDTFLACDMDNDVVLLLLDLSAAFDTVDHEVLLDRLQHWVGITGQALQWLRSYLQDRTFSVQMGEVTSPSVKLRWGVPQGSVLGPLLFAVYLLPLGVLLRQHNMKFHFFADDCQIYLPLQRGEDRSVSPLLDCLKDIKCWMASNFLHLNESKTEVIILSPGRRNGSGADIDLGPLTPYEKKMVSNLGIKIDSALNLDTHVNTVVRSCFFNLKRLSRIRPLLSRAHLESVLHAFVLSRLDYCNALYAGLAQCTVARLQFVQNSVARFLTGTRCREHITPVLAALHWLPVKYRAQFKILTLVYKALQGSAPPYITALLNRYTPSRSLRSAEQELLVVPRSKFRSRGSRAFSILAPTLWNELPLSIRQAPSLQVFKSRLKTHFYLIAFQR